MVKVNEYLGSFKKTNKKIPVLDSEKYRIEDNSHPVCYNLIDIENNINYRLRLKENKKDDDFYYAQEIINQSDNKYIYYKSAFSHYTIINTQTKEKWMIPNKKTCKSMCEELNKEPDRLQKENKQLKQKIKSIKEILIKDIGYVESFKKIVEILND